jgi:hypothetical protein
MNRILRGNAKAARGLKSDKMNLSPIAFGLAFAALATAAPSHAATINHANITGGASSFTSADGKLTLTPFAAGGGAGVFWASTAARTTAASTTSTAARSLPAIASAWISIWPATLV